MLSWFASSLPIKIPLPLLSDIASSTLDGCFLFRFSVASSLPSSTGTVSIPCASFNWFLSKLADSSSGPKWSDAFCAPSAFAFKPPDRHPFEQICQILHFCITLLLQLMTKGALRILLMRIQLTDNVSCNNIDTIWTNFNNKHLPN